MSTYLNQQSMLVALFVAPLARSLGNLPVVTGISANKTAGVCGLEMKEKCHQSLLPYICYIITLLNYQARAKLGLLTN